MIKKMKIIQLNYVKIKKRAGQSKQAHFAASN